LIIPSAKSKELRDTKVLEVRDACLSSRAERSAMYTRRRRYFMFGTNNYEQCRYNRLFSHLDLVCAFLYSPDHASFNIAAPLNSPDQAVFQATALGDVWNQRFRESGLAYQYGLALLWALVYDTMILKLGWNDARDKLFGKLIMPSSFGVYDETEPDFDAQEAFCHVYRLHWDEAVLRLYRAGMKDRVKDLGTRIGSPTDDMPPILKNLILTSQGSTNISANIMGQAPLDVDPTIRYEAKSDIPTVEFHEVWIWDSINEDYATFIIAEPDIILSDSRETIEKLHAESKDKVEYETKTNLFLPEATPFVPITPFPLPDYFWGEAHTERLIPLQEWTNERLAQIAEILEQQVDPPKVFSGFSGLSDEKAGAFGGPDTWVMDMIPGAKVEPLRPTMPDDIFAEFQSIGQIFLEASGLTETVTGKGEQGVRGKGHARQLATTGSARIRKTAINLEPSLVELGDIGIKLLQHNDDEEIITPQGEKFLARQFIPREWSLRIAGHSHSPLFVDEGRDLAALLFKAAAIDREMLIRLTHPPERDTMIAALRKRALMEQQQRQLSPGGQSRPNGKASQKGADHGTQA
jgi:hypothetical protein